MTIRRDIAVLMCSYPIETVCGHYGGGVRVADWFHLNHRNSNYQTLSPKQIALLKKLSNLPAPIVARTDIAPPFTA